MTTKEKIQFLINEGFSYRDIGRICECHSTVISKWLKEQANISKRMEDSIEIHLKSFVEKLYDLFRK